MFSTFLKEIKDIFNKWALISAFYPSLVFWTFAALFVLSRTEEWGKAQETLISWDKKALITLACLVWVSFWSFLTINLQPALVRVFEGNWPFKFLATVRRRFWQKRWQKMKDKDSTLAAELVVSHSERKAYEELRKGAKLVSNDTKLDGEKLDQFLKDLETRFNEPGAIDGLGRYVTQAWSYWNTIPSHPESLADGDPLWLDRRTRLMETIGRLLARLERQSEGLVKKADEQLSSFEKAGYSAGDLQLLGVEAREHWLSIRPYIESPLNGSEWMSSRSNHLLKIMDTLLLMLRQRQDEVEEHRLDHNRTFLLYYPPALDDVMPTRLGNVLKGADKRIYNRYRLDPAIMWSRLQPQLAKEFAESLQNVKGPFDLMITLSSFSVFFGSLLSAYESVRMHKPWLILVFVIVIPFLSIKFVARTLLAVLTLVVIWTFAAPLHIPIPEPPDTVFQFGTISMLVLGTGLLAWLTYENAVQACMVYCEKVQTAFDLYRWRILDEMHLQLPPNFEEERDIWKDLSGLLYRSEKPRASYYRYVAQDKKTKEPVRPLTRLSVPQKTLPPYYRITVDDITEIEISEAQVPVDAVRKKQDFVGKSSLRMLAGGTPVPRSCLIDAKTLEDTVAIGIQIDASHAVSGNLNVGSRVDLIMVPATNPMPTAISQSAATPPVPIIIDDTLVLDIKSTSDNTKLLLAVAIPVSRQSDYLSNLNSSFLVVYRLGDDAIEHSQQRVS
jgi:hypothetical protein